MNGGRCTAASDTAISANQLHLTSKSVKKLLLEIQELKYERKYLNFVYLFQYQQVDTNEIGHLLTCIHKSSDFYVLLERTYNQAL